MWFLALWGMGLISALVHLFIVGFPENISETSTIILLHQFIVTFGLVGIIGVIVNIVYAESTAKKLGWPGGLFQIKYGFSQLGLGIMGVMAIWFGGTFWLGVIVSMYIYGLSGLWSHTYIMVQNKKADADSVGNIIMCLLYMAFLTILSILAGDIWVTGSML
ncbi:hypothetical protein GCM10008968_21880 [Bacillus horti]